MIKKILLTLFLFFVISESSFGKSYLCMSEKMVMYGWSKDKGWQRGISSLVFLTLDLGFVVGVYVFLFLKKQ